MKIHRWFQRSAVAIALGSVALVGVASPADARVADWKGNAYEAYADYYNPTSTVKGGKVTGEITWKKMALTGYRHSVYLWLTDTTKNDGKYVQAVLRYGIHENGQWDTHWKTITNKKGGGNTVTWNARSNYPMADVHVRVCTVSVKTNKPVACDKYR